METETQNMQTTLKDEYMKLPMDEKPAKPTYKVITQLKVKEVKILNGKGGDDYEGAYIHAIFQAGPNVDVQEVWESYGGIRIYKKPEGNVVWVGKESEAGKLRKLLQDTYGLEIKNPSDFLKNLQRMDVVGVKTEMIGKAVEIPKNRIVQIISSKP